MPTTDKAGGASVINFAHLYLSPQVQVFRLSKKAEFMTAMGKTGGEDNSQKTKTHPPTHLCRLPHRATQAVDDASGKNAGRRPD